MTQHVNLKSKFILTLILIAIFMMSIFFIEHIDREFDSKFFQSTIDTPALQILGSRIASTILPFQQLFSSSENACYVSTDQTVVEWKSTYYARCRIGLGDFCFWPLTHEHKTYKVTVTDGIPLRSYIGNIIAAINEEKTNWRTYDADQWNELEFNPRNRYIDFETISSNEYVVMVQTRYRMFNDVESTLGVCMQTP